MESSLAMEHLMGESICFSVQLRKVTNFLLGAFQQFIQVLVFILEPLGAKNDGIPIAICISMTSRDAECTTGNWLTTFFWPGQSSLDLRSPFHATIVKSPRFAACKCDSICGRHLPPFLDISLGEKVPCLLKIGCFDERAVATCEGY